MSGKFIVLEGIDGSGKETQSKLLASRLKEMGKKVYCIDFPQYNTALGQVIKSFLHGGLGPLEKIESEVKILLYALDRYQFKKELEMKLKENYIIIADRYTQSNLAFQTATLPNKEELLNWIECVESRLPKPDLILFLDVPPEKNMNVKKDKDKYEKNLDFQFKVYENYKWLAKKYKWKMIECLKNGKIKTKREINDLIFNEVEKIL